MAYNLCMANEVWTTKKLIAWTATALESHDVDSPRLSAEMLLAHVLDVKRLKLYMDPDRPASELERAAFRTLVERAMKHEPVDYLVGHAPFFSMMFKVSPAVLIPRPSTETLVEHVLQHARRTPGFSKPRLVDIGTGSGTIAVSLARQFKRSGVEAVIIATDISPQALAVAEENAKTHDVLSLIDFREGDLYEPIKGEQFHYVLSNPPYIPDHEWGDVAPNVKDHEPVAALRGGADGLDLIRPLIANACDYLLDPGQLLIEIASCQRDEVIELACGVGLRHAAVLADHENLPRILVADSP